MPTEYPINVIVKVNQFHMHFIVVRKCFWKMFYTMRNVISYILSSIDTLNDKDNKTMLFFLRISHDIFQKRCRSFLVHFMTDQTRATRSRRIRKKLWPNDTKTRKSMTGQLNIESLILMILSVQIYSDVEIQLHADSDTYVKWQYCK